FRPVRTRTGFPRARRRTELAIPSFWRAATARGGLRKPKISPTGGLANPQASPGAPSPRGKEKGPAVPTPRQITGRRSVGLHPRISLLARFDVARRPTRSDIQASTKGSFHG